MHVFVAAWKADALAQEPNVPEGHVREGHVRSRVLVCVPASGWVPEQSLSRCRWSRHGQRHQRLSSDPVAECCQLVHVL